MKNSILGKARWLREVALATSKNNGARVAREWLKYAAMFIMLFTIGSGNVWGATSTLTLSSNNKFGTSSGSTKTSSDEIVTWKANTTKGAIQNTYSGSNAYNGQQFGTGKAVWTGTFTTSSISTKKITSVAIVANTGGSATLNVSVGGTTYTDKNQSVTKKANGATPLTYTFSGTNTGSITITVSNTSQAFYLQSIAVTYEDAVPTTTVTASPASITFDRVTLDPEYGAEGSKNVTISLTNGNVGYPGGVPCYLNGWVETDETDCEFYVNSLYAYQKATSTTSETLSLSYYATDAGTFTGNFIIQGFNASQEAVNCTIPLSVIVDVPACDKTVTINKGTETNCSFTLSMSGAQASCAGVSTTVTVTPNTGYESPSVTQSGASNTPTITGSGTSWTVTYPANTTGTSVINVSCSAKTTTISFDQNGGTGGQTSTKTATYGQAMPTPITTPTRTGYTFEGYYDGSGGTGNKYYNADGSSAANWNKDAATATLYAKWTANKYTVTWSVNGSTYTTTENVAYNTTTSTPKNPSVPGECTGSTFMGWTATENYSNAISAPRDLFNGTTPTITGNKTFYAVFADEN